MAPHTFPRRAATTNDIIAVHIVATVAIFVVLLCLLWFLCFYRSKAKRRILEPTAALFRVRGVVRPTMAETTPSSTRSPSPSNQHGRTTSIVTPEISITRKSSSHSLSDKTTALCQLEPSPTSSTSSLHRTPSNASSVMPPSRPRAMLIPDPTCSRHNRSSSAFTVSQYFSPPGLSSRPPSTISTPSSQVKRVRQLFRSALPDELSLVRYDEHLTVLRSFDDGWCLVTRDTSRSSRASRLSAWIMGNSDNVDIGFVPAWVFIEPSRGVTVTRPFRLESINTPHLGQNPAPTRARDTIVSGFDSE